MSNRLIKVLLMMFAIASSLLIATTIHAQETQSVERVKLADSIMMDSDQGVQLMNEYIITHPNFHLTSMVVTEHWFNTRVYIYGVKESK